MAGQSNLRLEWSRPTLEDLLVVAEAMPEQGCQQAVSVLRTMEDDRNVTFAEALERTWTEEKEAIAEAAESAYAALRLVV